MGNNDSQSPVPPFRELTRAAWFEAKVNGSAQGGAPEAMLGTYHPPRSFVDEELGFGFGEGPSLQVTLLHLEAHNRRARKMLGAKEGKKKKKRKRETAEVRRERLLHAAVDALVQKR